MKQQRPSSEPEASPPSPGGECGDAPFRVRVCLQRYFRDERARAYVCVRGRRRVRWLAARLRALFALPPPFALLSRGHLLPPDEPLALLRRDDVVDVVPTRVDLDGCRADADELGPVSRALVATSATGANDSDAAEDRRSPATEPDSEVGTPTPSEPTYEDNGENDLSEHKRRALRILDQYCQDEQFGDDTQRAPRWRRVRRRRRRRRDSPAPCSPAPAPAGEAAVLRNGAQGPRPPRLIRPLADGASS